MRTVYLRNRQQDRLLLVNGDCKSVLDATNPTLRTTRTKSKSTKYILAYVGYPCGANGARGLRRTAPGCASFLIENLARDPGMID